MNTEQRAEVRNLVEKMLSNVPIEYVDVEVDENGCPWISNTDGYEVYVDVAGSVHGAESYVPVYKYGCYVALSASSEDAAKALVERIIIPDGYTLKVKCAMGASSYTTDDSISLWMLATLVGNKI